MVHPNTHNVYGLHFQIPTGSGRIRDLIGLIFFFERREHNTEHDVTVLS